MHRDISRYMDSRILIANLVSKFAKFSSASLFGKTAWKFYSEEGINHPWLFVRGSFSEFGEKVRDLFPRRHLLGFDLFAFLNLTQYPPFMALAHSLKCSLLSFQCFGSVASFIFASSCFSICFSRRIIGLRRGSSVRSPNDFRTFKGISSEYLGPLRPSSSFPGLSYR